MPKSKGTYRLQVTLKNRPKEVKTSVHSRWDFNVSEAVVPESVKSKRLAIPSYEKELIDFANDNKLNVVDPNLVDDFDVLLLSKDSWLKIKEDKSVPQGKDIIWTEKTTYMGLYMLFGVLWICACQVVASVDAVQEQNRKSVERDFKNIRNFLDVQQQAGSVDLQEF